MQLTKINGKYELWLPEHRAARPEWKLENGGWEVARINAMVSHITAGDIVFDIGTEEGDISALIAKYTGCEMVLFEPNDRVWPCIKAIWEANKLQKPLHFYPGFLSNIESDDRIISLYDYNEHWNRMTHSDMVADHGFKQLYENYPAVPQIKLDDYCDTFGICPTVITMDCEGSEWEIIKGAERTLRNHRPTIFMSIHPEFLYESYRNEGIWKEKYGERCFVVHMLRFINELGYKHSIIEWDYHECHARFDPI